MPAEGAPWVGLQIGLSPPAESGAMQGQLLGDLELVSEPLWDLLGKGDKDPSSRHLNSAFWQNCVNLSSGREVLGFWESKCLQIFYLSLWFKGSLLSTNWGPSQGYFRYLPSWTWLWWGRNSGEKIKLMLLHSNQGPDHQWSMRVSNWWFDFSFSPIPSSHSSPFHTGKPPFCLKCLCLYMFLQMCHFLHPLHLYK